MTKNLMPYYISRAGISILITGLMIFTGSHFWLSFLSGALILIMFIIAPLSRRYSVHPEFGITALRRDDFTSAVNEKSARNGFVAVTILITGAAGFSAALGGGLVTAQALKLMLLTGLLVYYISDFFYRRV
jgi:hypothetical protein